MRLCGGCGHFHNLGARRAGLDWCAVTSPEHEDDTARGGDPGHAHDPAVEAGHGPADDAARAPRTVILLAGPSGSGKSRLVRVTGARQLRLDDFYFADTQPGLPMRDGRIDWDDVGSWDVEAAVRALQELVATGRTMAPLYSIQQNRATGTHRVELAPGEVLVAEGIFAPDLLAHCRTRGVLVRPVWLDRPRVANFSRRLRRDLAQKRKPPAVLVRRGMVLLREEHAKRDHALALGFEPMTMRRLEALVGQLQQR